jgi:antitoxin FitA
MRDNTNRALDAEEYTHSACVVVIMPSLQIRDMPEDLYEALAARAGRQRRSLAQQAVSDLSRIEELEARKRRELVVERLRGRSPRRISDPVRIVRADRER